MHTLHKQHIPLLQHTYNNLPEGKLLNRDLQSLSGASDQKLAGDKKKFELNLSGGLFYTKLMNSNFLI